MSKIILILPHIIANTIYMYNTIFVIFENCIKYFEFKLLFLVYVYVYIFVIHFFFCLDNYIFSILFSVLVILVIILFELG